MVMVISTHQAPTGAEPPGRIHLARERGNIMNRRLQRATVLSVTGFALLGAASSAIGVDMERSRGGVHAWSRGANGQIAVKDTAGDSKEVYADYKRRYTEHELRNSSGNGTTVYSSNDETNYVRGFKACVAVNFQPDDCTTWAWR